MTPCSAGRDLGGRTDLGDSVLECIVVRGAGVQPGPDRRAHAVGAARLGDDLAERGQRTMLGGGLAGGQHGARVGQHRVVPVGEPGRARVVGAAGEVEAPPPVRPDALGDADRGAHRRQGPALLDVQLDERAEPREQVLVGSDQAGVAARGGHRRGQRDAVVVAEGAGRTGFDGPGHQAAPQAGHPEAGALFLGEDGDCHGPFGIKVPGLQLGHGGQRGRHPERSVVSPAVGDRIQVAAGDDGVLPGRAPPGPQVAVAVLLRGQAESVRLAGEPGAAFGVRRGPGVAAVAARGVTTDRFKLPPELGKAHCSAMGTRTPRWVATSAARS